VRRVERSFDLERWPEPEQLAQVLLAIRGRHPEIMKDAKVKDFIETLEEAVFQKTMMEDLKRK
jgi:hypothetical protein